MEITLGDIIGYALAIIIALLGITGFGIFIFNKKKKIIKQNKNVVINGDIVGGNKIRKSYSKK